MRTNRVSTETSSRTTSQPPGGNRGRRIAGLAGLAALSLAICSVSLGDGGVSFTDLVQQPSSGLVYQRTASPTDAAFDQLKQMPVFTIQDVAFAPIKPRGAPGVALFDHDRDGDLDIYVTNGPGTANSLFSSQLRETGALTFVDVGAASGAGAASQDSTGVCFGDIDNDGDQDLYVLGNAEPNLLLENQGGSFVDVTVASGAGGGNLTSTSCSFGDVDGDGLLDLVVANAYTDWTQPLGIIVVPFALNEHNQLFVNQGGGVFSDESAASGLLQNRGFAAADDGKAGLTWAIAMVDYDHDGDVDIFMADDQGGVPFAGPSAVVRGILHLFENDGTGHFVDRAPEAGLVQPGGWMALTFGDLDCDAELDFFSSNFGDYVSLFNSGGAAPTGTFPSRWFLGDGAGGFTDPGVGSLGPTPFGWGAGIFDYDNDGDGDILYHGGMDLALSIEASNAGVLLQNQGCSASFVRDTGALAGSVDHGRRTVNGVAIGDLDGDGFEDIVSVSNFDMPFPIPRLSVPGAPPSFADAGIVPTFAPTGNPGEFVFTGVVYQDGTLSVELNSGGNGNRWLQADLLGTVGLTSGGTVNRDGIGAVVEVRRSGGGPAPQQSVHAVVGGSSYASQHSLTVSAGLGNAPAADLEILWPGGVRNRLYGVGTGERVTIPEIPCSFDDPGFDFAAYQVCVDTALGELAISGVIGHQEAQRLRSSAVRAFQSTD